MRWESALQNRPPVRPSAKRVTARVRACAGAAPSTSATKMLAMPARSERNATRRPSGDQTGFDGWRMSTSCSIVSPAARCGCAACATNSVTPSSNTRVTPKKGFIPGSINPTFRTTG